MHLLLNLISCAPRMTSQQDCFQIPRIITPPVMISASVGGYLSNGEYRSPPRSTSLARPAVNTTNPATFQDTQSMESRSPSHGRIRANMIGENSARSHLSSSQDTRVVSDPGCRLTILSPSVSSRGGSIQSSDTGHSQCSFSSSEYLTPAQFQSDFDERPYRARRDSSCSLTMVQQSKTADTVPHGKAPKRHRNYRQKHKCQHERSHGYQYLCLCCLPVCQVAPTAPKGMKELCIVYDGTCKPFLSLRGSKDTYGHTLPRLWSDPAPPLISRRWSSVEIGSQQIRLPSTLPAKPTPSIPEVRHRRRDPDCPTHKLTRPCRSSTFTRGATYHDIVHTIRAKLTDHKVPYHHLETPTTITLRRASDSSDRSGLSIATEGLTRSNRLLTESNIPRPYSTCQDGEEPETAFLLTSKEINTITELIESNLQPRFRSHQGVSVHSQAKPPTGRILPPSSISKSMQLKEASRAILVVTNTEPEATCAPLQETLGYLQPTSPSWTCSQPHSQPLSQTSAPEIIWEAGGSPNSPCSMEESVRSRSSTSNGSTPASTTLHATLPTSPWPSARTENGDAFDPKNARESISEWSLRLPQAEIPGIATSSESEINYLSPASKAASNPKARPQTRSVASAPEVSRLSTKIKPRSSARPVLTSSEGEDVVFFPPLPTRKTTNDWYSPLLDIDCSPTKSPPQSLYNNDIDAIGALQTIIPAPKPQKRPRFSVRGLPESLTSGVVDINPHCDLLHTRHKSVVRAHPQAPARTGTQASMGSSIGASSRERKRSSIKPGIKRVQTIDHANKGSRAGTWTRNRPPSVCPPPISASPAEISDNESLGAMTPPPTKSSGPVDRTLHHTGPPLPKMVWAATYARITETLKSTLGLRTCKDDSPTY